MKYNLKLWLPQSNFQNIERLFQTVLLYSLYSHKKLGRRSPETFESAATKKHTIWQRLKFHFDKRFTPLSNLGTECSGCFRRV